VPKPATHTKPEELTEGRLKRQRAARRAMLAVLALFLVLGVFEVFGSKTDAVSATGAGYTLTVAYPSVTRPGLPIRWEIQVENPNGFEGPIELRTTFDYLHLFDISNLEPEPSSSTGTMADVVYTFEPPAGEIFRVSMDGNAEAGLHEIPSATTSLFVDGSVEVSVTYSTRVVP
jgi:hypothetical protein